MRCSECALSKSKMQRTLSSKEKVVKLQEQRKKCASRAKYLKQKTTQLRMKVQTETVFGIF